MNGLSDLQKGFLFIVVGLVALIILFNIISSTSPLLFDIMDSCDPATHDCSMIGPGKIMISLIGFVFASGMLITGIRILLGSFSQQNNYSQRGY